MTWNKDLPEDTQKMRTLSSVIRDNWEAIQLAGSTLKPQALNFLARDTDGGIPANAPAVANAYVLYSKNTTVNSVTKPELFYTDPSGNSLQLTGHPVGVSGTFSTNGESVLPGGFFIKWAKVTVPSGDNTSRAFTWQGTTAPAQLGLTAFPNNCFSITITGDNNSFQTIDSYVDAVTATGFTIRKASTNSVVTYYVIAIGN